MAGIPEPAECKHFRPMPAERGDSFHCAWFQEPAFGRVRLQPRHRSPPKARALAPEGRSRLSLVATEKCTAHFVPVKRHDLYRKAGIIGIQWEARVQSALTLHLLAIFCLLAFPASFAQTIDPQTGAICEPQPTAMNAVRSKAETGDPAAEYELGVSLLGPKPTDSEFALAMPWFRRSAEQGYGPAEYIYGGIFRDGRWKNPQQLVYWWTKAAEQGNLDAELWLGVFYEQGSNGVERDYQKALKWLSAAAKQGQPDAQVTLGQMYENSEGVPQDYRSAAFWYRKAADHTMDLGGAGAGANSLAQLFEHGHSTSLDYVFVYLWYAYTGNAGELHEVAKKMNPSEIADAQRRIKAWVNTGPPCPSVRVSSLPAGEVAK